MSDPGGTSDWIIALAGGAVGSIVTALIAVAARALSAWGDVADHDLQARDLNQALEWWVSDRSGAVSGEIASITNGMAARGLLYSGALDTAVLAAKSRALRDYRDRHRQTELGLSRLRASEGPWHRVWRTLRRRRRGLEMTAALRVEPFLDGWRAPVPSSTGGEAIAPTDHSRRTLEEAIDALPAKWFGSADPPR